MIAIGLKYANKNSMKSIKKMARSMINTNLRQIKIGLGSEHRNRSTYLEIEK